MMPVFFHTASHLWIFYLFFLNGLLIHYLLRSRSSKYANCTQPVEAQVCAAFFVSMSLNGILLLGVDILGGKISQLIFVLPVVTLVLLISLFTLKGAQRGIFSVDFSAPRLVLYVLVFTVLFYNGGLIEHVTDAWWHMALANQIGYANSFDLDTGPLNGLNSNYYPPLWHGNLALANVLSGISLPVFWNSFTAWGAVVKVMGFYLLAYSLAGRKNVAFLSAVLFVLLPGIGDSYLRVAAWPSHISYTAWFCLFYVMFFAIDRFASDSLSSLRNWLELFVAQRVYLGVFLLLSGVVYFVHRAELLWFFIGMVAYVIAVTVHANCADEQGEIEDWSNTLFRILARTILLACLSVGVWFITEQQEKALSSLDFAIVFLLPVIIFAGISCLAWLSPAADVGQRRWLAYLFIFILVTALVLTIDLRQLMSLFDPEQAYAIESSLERALHATGVFGERLQVPGWHHQLRFGLLYSGIVSIPLALFMAIVKPTRLSLFTAGTGTLAILVCCSPYLYQWLVDILNYHSVWRIALLIFHPIVIAAFAYQLWDSLSPDPSTR
ncbi:MAG: hypothetical protein AAF431_09235 [Pseudomonadota bacterium]